jgi:hypothetical protein
MTAVTTQFYNHYHYNKAKNLIGDLESEDTHIYILLTDDTYVPDFVNDDSLEDIIGEMSGEGYTTGGIELTDKLLTLTEAGLFFSASDVLLEDSTLTGVKNYVMYEKKSEDADSKLILCGYLAVAKSSSESDILVDFSAISIFSQPFA